MNNLILALCSLGAASMFLAITTLIVWNSIWCPMLNISPLPTSVIVAGSITASFFLAFLTRGEH